VTNNVLACREAVPADADMLADLCAKVFRAAYRSAYESEKQLEDFVAARMAPASVQADLQTDAGRCSLGSVNGVPAGFVQMKESRPPECVGDSRALEVWKLYVLQQFQGSGIADALLRWGLERAIEGGAAQVWLCVWEHSHRAQAFYRRHGFSAVGETFHVWGGVSFCDFVMARRVTQYSAGQREAGRSRYA
jgi:ribosomal protein S18 acetylase RimI-like enzyme